MVGYREAKEKPTKIESCPILTRTHLSSGIEAVGEAGPWVALKAFCLVGAFFSVAVLEKGNSEETHSRMNDILWA